MNSKIPIQSDNVDSGVFANTLFTELVSIFDSVSAPQLYTVYEDLRSTIGGGNKGFMVDNEILSDVYDEDAPFSENYKSVLNNGDASNEQMIQLSDATQNDTHTYIASSSLTYVDDVHNKVNLVFTTMKTLYAQSESLARQSSSLMRDKQNLMAEVDALNGAITSVLSVNVDGFTMNKQYFELSPSNPREEFFVVGGRQPYHIEVDTISYNNIEVEQDDENTNRFTVSIRDQYTRGEYTFTIIDSDNNTELGAVRITT